MWLLATFVGQLAVTNPTSGLCPKEQAPPAACARCAKQNVPSPQPQPCVAVLYTLQDHKDTALTGTLHTWAHGELIRITRQGQPQPFAEM
jgi:hypothetical protein